MVCFPDLPLGMCLVDLVAYVSRVEGLGAGLFLVGWCWWDLDLVRFSFCWGWFGVVARLWSGVAAVEVSVCVLSTLAVVGDVGCFLVFSWVL